jgi:hypothetical protein
VRWSPLCPQGGPAAGGLAITFPRAGEVFLIEPGYDLRTQTVELTAEVDPPADEVTWLIDGRPLARGRLALPRRVAAGPRPPPRRAARRQPARLPVEFEVR